MKKTTLHTFTFAMAAFYSLGGYAQDKPKKIKMANPTEVVRCATVEYEAMLQKNDPYRPTEQQFEDWIAKEIEATKSRRTAYNVNTVVTIPVVVHVIHNGDALGTNENITAEQIQSQITVLNQDFSRQENTPGFNDNPVGASMDIAFCLAQRDPNGLASTGITRHSLGSDLPWQMAELEVIKTQTQWDPSRYLNIWVVNQILVNNIFELAGYAQFPTGSGLNGLSQGTATTANTDGVAIGYRYFGSQELYPQGTYDFARNTGRTTTHEIGHFFGLRHIWGDSDDCIASDYCADTPVARTANSGCPEPGHDSCPARPGVDMFENYMDYTADVCQNIFTQNQKDRMQAVVTNSPRRSTLVTALSCSPGLVFTNDGSLDILNINNNCSNAFAPQLTLTNSGTATLTEAVIMYNIDSDVPQAFNWTGSLEQGEETNVTLPDYSAPSGNYTLNVDLTSVNGVEDEAPLNDNRSQQFNIKAAFNTAQVVVTIATDDFGDETIWALRDRDNNYLFTNVDITNPQDAEFYESNTVYTQTLDVDPNQCYTFTILDLSGDGMCCTSGNGYYNIKTAEDVLITSGGFFSVTESFTFNITDTLLATEGAAVTPATVKLYPNPAHNVVNIATPRAAVLPGGYTVYNSVGQVVNRGKIDSYDQELNIAAYANGVYFIKLDGNAQTLQFIKY